MVNYLGKMCSRRLFSAGCTWLLQVILLFFFKLSLPQLFWLLLVNFFSSSLAISCNCFCSAWPAFLKACFILGKLLFKSIIVIIKSRHYPAFSLNCFILGAHKFQVAIHPKANQPEQTAFLKVVVFKSGALTYILGKCHKEANSSLQRGLADTYQPHHAINISPNNSIFSGISTTIN